MENLLSTIVKNLVNDPSKIKITKKEEDGFIILNLYVAEDDLGKVIGKQGKIANAIRTILKSYANYKGKKVIIKIN